MPYMKEQTPLPGIYDPDFIAANQDTRADNTIKGTRSEQVQQVRQQIRTFKEEQKLDKVHTTLLHLLIVRILALRIVCILSTLLCLHSHALGIHCNHGLSCIAACIELYMFGKPSNAHMLIVWGALRYW